MNRFLPLVLWGAVASVFFGAGTRGSATAPPPEAVIGTAPVSVPLAPVANVYGLVNTGSPVPDGGVDGSGDAYSETLMGTSITWLGATFAVGIESEHYLGPARFKYPETAAFLAAQGACIAYGSDWCVDPLDEWFVLQIGVTRANPPGAAHRYPGRLSEDAGLTRAQVLRAITMNSSYELHQERSTGSLKVGKLADFVVLDRNVLQIPAEDIARVKVLRTVEGGQVVYETR